MQKVNWNNLIKQISTSEYNEQGQQVWTYRDIAAYLEDQGVKPCSKTTIGRLATDANANPKFDMGMALIELHRAVTTKPEEA